MSFLLETFINIGIIKSKQIMLFESLNGPGTVHSNKSALKVRIFGFHYKKKNKNIVLHPTNFFSHI